MYTFFQVCVGASLAADHVHNREHVPLKTLSYTVDCLLILQEKMICPASFVSFTMYIK